MTLRSGRWRALRAALLLGDARRWVEVDRVRVRGKQQSVTHFTPVAGPGSAFAPSDEEMRLWELALTAYRQQHWDPSQACLQRLRMAFAGSAFIGPYTQLDERIDHYLGTPPPADRDGAYTFDSK